MQIERLTPEEYSHFLSYAEPAYHVDIPSFSDHDNDSQLPEAIWISTLASTTFPGMTFGYIDVL